MWRRQECLHRTQATSRLGKPPCCSPNHGHACATLSTIQSKQSDLTSSRRGCCTASSLVGGTHCGRVQHRLAQCRQLLDECCSVRSADATVLRPTITPWKVCST